MKTSHLSRSPSPKGGGAPVSKQVFKSLSALEIPAFRRDDNDFDRMSDDEVVARILAARQATRGLDEVTRWNKSDEFRSSAARHDRRERDWQVVEKIEAYRSTPAGWNDERSADRPTL